jgi:hypothetical protein
MLRELMPKCHITAVDRDSACVLAAIDAGADEAFECDLSDYYDEVWERPKTEWSPKEKKHIPAGTMTWQTRRPNRLLWQQERYDIVNLDLCSNISSATKRLVTTYRQLLTSGGAYTSLKYSAMYLCGATTPASVGLPS